MWSAKPKFCVSLALLGLLAAPARAGEEHRLDLSIVGTKMEVDKVGLPARLEGMVFFRGGPRDGGIAGTYEETLRPLLDPELGLVGTIGESVFHFWKRNGRTVGSDRLVSRNRSTIVGEIPQDGALLVESTGRITEARPDRNEGTLRSNATVRLGGQFELDVNVTLIFGASEDGARSARGHERDAADGTSLVVTVGPDGATEVRYGREFKRRVMRRLTGTDAVSPAALSAEMGLSEVLLSRWRQQAGLLAMLRKMQSSLRPAQRQLTFEEKLGIVLETATYSEEELDEFISLEGLSREELAKFRFTIEAALESGRAGDTDDAGESDEAGADPEDEARGLAELKKRVEALLGEGSGEESDEESP